MKPCLRLHAESLSESVSVVASFPVRASKFKKQQRSLPQTSGFKLQSENSRLFCFMRQEVRSRAGLNTDDIDFDM